MFKKVSWISLLVCSLYFGIGSASAADKKVMLTQSFHHADIVSVIAAVSKLTGKNFIIDPRVKGKVTLLAPEPMPPQALYETLLLILKVHGFVAIPGPTAIRIVPSNLARDQVPFSAKKHSFSENWVTEVLPVHFVAATKLVAILRPLVAREGHLVGLSESNQLIVTDTLSNIQRIKSILKRVDVDENASFEVIPLHNTSAEEVARTVSQALPKNSATPVKVTFDGRTNRVILSGSPAERIKVRALIAELDVPMASEGSVQVVYLHYAKAKNLVPILQKISTNQSLLNRASQDSTPSRMGENNTSEPVSQLSTKTLKNLISIEADDRMNAIVISAPPQVLTTLKGVIKQLDIRRAQVLIEAIVVEVSEAKQAKLGVEWGAKGPSGVGVINFSGAIPSLVGAAVNPAVAATTKIATGTTAAIGELKGATGWGALISALSGDSEANILSTPTLLTLDNEEAEIIVGKEVPFQTGSYTSTGSGSNPTNPFNTIVRKNVGLKLKVKPQINEGNAVFLHIDQEISDVLPKSDAVDLETSKRQIKTNIIVGDGNVVVLGGLLSEKETEVTNKVPGLGDIPWVGGLFRYKSKQREKVNLMIFLRPVIVRDNAMSNYYSEQKYTYLRDQQDKLLHQDTGLIQGLRPRMPTLDQWKHGKPATPIEQDSAQKSAINKTIVVKPKASKHPVKTDTSMDDLLDL